jgi:hypothetical protein
MNQITESQIQSKVESAISAFKDTFLNYTYPFDKEVSIQSFFYRHLMEDEELILKERNKYYLELVKPEFKIHKQVAYNGYYDLVILNPEYVSYVLDREKNYISNSNKTIRDQFCYADVLSNYYYNERRRTNEYLQPAIKNKNILYCFEFKYLANNHQKANDIIYGLKNNGKNCVKNDIERLRESVDFGIKYPICIFVSNSNAGKKTIDNFRNELSQQNVSENRENKVRVIIIESSYASPHYDDFKNYSEFYI